MNTEILKDLFAHFGMTLLIALIDFIIVLGSCLIGSEKQDAEEVYIELSNAEFTAIMLGLIANIVSLSVVLSVLILG